MADRTVVYRLRAELTQFRAQMAQGSASVKKFGDDLTAVDREGAKVRRGLDFVGRVAGGVGVVAAAGLAVAVAKAADFEQAMSNVQAATHESAQNMEALRQAALDAGQETVFSATESAAAIENLAKAGVATNDILGGGLQGALDLAAAGSLEVADAAEIAATALTQFGLSGEDVPHVADLLAAGAGKAQGEVSDLSYALKQSGLVAAQMGVSIEETTGTLSAFASAGLLGSDAGTSFRTMLLRLANPSVKAKEELEQFGIAAYDLQGNFVGIESLAAQLQTAFEGQTQATRDAAFATIFGSDAIRGANVLYQQGASGIASWTDRVDDTGFAAETAAIKLDNLKGDLEELSGALETALIGTGDGAQGPLRQITQGLTAVINRYNDLPPAAQNAVGALMAGSAVLGGSIWVGTKIVRGISDTREALENLGVSTDKLGRGLRGVGRYAGIAAAGLAALSAVDSLQRQFEGLDSSVEGLTGQLLDLSDVSTDQLAGEFSNLGESFERLTDPNRAQAFQDSIYDTFGFLGSDSRVDEAVAQFEAIDAALANIATTGSPEQARGAFAALATSLGVTGEAQKELLELTPEYTAALEGAENVTRLTGDATEDAAGATKALGRAAGPSAEQIKKLEEALKDQRDAAMDSAQTFVNLGDSVDNGKKSLQQWLVELEKQAAALRDFRRNSAEAAKRGLDEGLIASLQEAGEVGALRMRQLANATDGEIKRANEAWQSGQREINRYVDATVKVPKALATDVTVNGIESAISRVDALGRELSGLQNRTVTINTVFTSSGQRFKEFGPGYATGGAVYGAGTATSDSIPAWLSNGEFVIKAAAVQKYGMNFFHRLNAMRFADGGAVGVPRAQMSVAAPAVSVGGAQVRVFVDGREVRAVVDERISDRQVYAEAISPRTTNRRRSE